MATANFYAECGEYFVLDSFDCEDFEYGLKDDIVEQLKKEFKGIYKYENGLEKWDNNRSYPAKIFAEADVLYMCYHEAEVEVVAEFMVRSGYYTGCNLDYKFRYYLNGVEVESIEEIKLDWENYSQYYTHAIGAFKAHLDKKISQIEDTISDAVSAIDKVYNKFATKFCKMGQFSNGEAIYKVC